MPTRVLLRAALAAACLGGAIASAMIYVSQTRLQDAVIAVQKPHQCKRALREIRASESPLNPSVFRNTVLAGCLMDAGRVSEGDRTIRDVAASQPENAEVWVTLAFLQFGRGQRRAARASYAHAQSLDPHLPPPSF